jgi:hypothetical protein
MTRKITAAGVASANGGFPVAGYDDVSVDEISDELDGPSEEQLKRVREYEKRHMNRETLIEQIDRKVKTVHRRARY